MRMFFLCLLMLSCSHAVTSAHRSTELNNRVVVGDSLQSILQKCNDAILKMDYIGSWRCFVSNESVFAGKTEQFMFDQHFAAALSFIGEENSSRRIFDRLNTSIPPLETLDLSDYVVRDAESEIVSKTKDRQIVLINEAHHVPETRLLTLRLLKPLFDQGFRYFAAESLNKDFLERTVQQGFATFDTGYYVAEPIYASLIREALRLGFKLVPYESVPPCDPFNDPPEKCQNLREEGQARNIYEAVFKSDPSAKVLVHAGYGHIAKKGGYDGWNWVPMARALWELTKIEPYSIDQTFFYERGNPKLDSDIYNLAVDKARIEKPSVFVNKASKELFVYSRYKGDYDAQVFLPRLRLLDGRPAWRKDIPGAQRVQIEAIGCPKYERCLVQAFFENEKDLRFVPIDQALSDGKPVSLYLLPGKYLINVFNPNGEQESQRKHVVTKK
jgi:hypothetical protein